MTDQEWLLERAMKDEEINLLEKRLQEEMKLHRMDLFKLEKNQRVVKSEVVVLRKLNEALNAENAHLRNDHAREVDELLRLAAAYQFGIEDPERDHYMDERRDRGLCPRCGSSDVSPEDYDYEGNGVGAFCGDCGFRESYGMVRVDRPYHSPGSVDAHDLEATHEEYAPEEMEISV